MTLPHRMDYIKQTSAKWCRLLFVTTKTKEWVEQYYCRQLIKCKTFFYSHHCVCSILPLWPILLGKIFLFLGVFATQICLFSSEVEISSLCTNCKQVNIMGSSFYFKFFLIFTDDTIHTIFYRNSWINISDILPWHVVMSYVSIWQT